MRLFSGSPFHVKSHPAPPFILFLDDIPTIGYALDRLVGLVIPFTETEPTTRRSSNK